MKKLKLFSGRIGGGHKCGYIAAYSQAEAGRIAEVSIGELRNYWCPAWGNTATLALGAPDEPCFWIYDEKKREFERQDKQEPVIPAGGHRGSGRIYTKFADIPKFTRTGEWECDFPLQRIWAAIEEWQRDDGLNLDPDFQRAHVWTAPQQVAWIEYFLRGGRTGRVIYLNNPSWQSSRRAKDYDEFVLVDGKQRLEAIRRFLRGEIRVFGSLYSEFADGLGLDYTMKVNINDLRTKREVLQFYIDFNSGGVVHSNEEIARVRSLMQ